MPEIAGQFVGWHASAKLLHMIGDRIQGSVLHGGPIMDGSLAKLVRYVMSQPENERWRYSIATDGPLLDLDGIYELAGQLDAGA